MSSGTGEIKISSQSDADALSSCDSISGTLVITPSARGTIRISDVEEIKGPLTIKDADELRAVRAEDLETVTGPLTVENNKHLTSLELDELGSVGGELRIKGNERLREVRLDDLESVNGGVVLEGGFVGYVFSFILFLRLVWGANWAGCDRSSGYDTTHEHATNTDSLSLSNLEKVRGATTIASSARDFSCSSLDDLKSEGAFDSDFNCSENSSSSDSDNDSDNDGDDDESSGLSTGAKAGIAVGVILGVLLILLVIWLGVRRHRRQRVAQKEALAALGGAAAGTKSTGDGGGRISDEEKGEMNHTSSSVSPVSPDETHKANALAIPRKPLSPAPQETGIVSINGTSNSNSNSNPNTETGPGTAITSLPSSLVAGDNRFSTVSALGTSESDPSLFLRPMRRAPSESDVPMLDSGDVHEAPVDSGREVDPPFELDAGPVRGTHQQAIHHE